MQNLVSLDQSGLDLVGGSHLSTGLELDTGWHVHDMHQLQYAFEGSIEVEDAEGRHLVPHQFGVWIPRGIEHRTWLKGGGSGSLFLREGLPGTDSETDSDRIRIIRVPPLMREMILESMRWPILEGYTDAAGTSFFITFALLCKDWLAERAELVLPVCDDPRITRIMAYTVEHLSSVTLEDVCQAVGMSSRTLRRKFSAKMGMTWEEYRLRCRLFRAVELLEDTSVPILEIAMLVGYKSQSAFTKAFKALMRETPSNYRNHVLAG
ncbi:AraC family transcriptional regulator [Mangrovimicrobium sediminis]|uniref:AraC family transcriptional regulator n=1 Tax=Mangrovimicrobium sediminis TaxID=2562682 RepID=A0A4Z0M5T5_9GAMM|nr:helix-turn-helix transcriptional regulator [Haliea sp. SAOS-164]TGD74738.1 AraC family transcriptional regulator [Haliea sp. SAOS-164]